MTFKTIDEQWSLISRGAEEILPEKELKFKLVHKNKSYFSVINEQREGGFF